MRKKKNLQSLQTLAQGKENRWQRHVSNQMHSLRNEKQRLDQLNDYLDEYVDKARTAGSAQSIMAMRTRQSFVDRLRSAVDQQQKTVAEQEVAAERGVERWKQARSKSLALEKYGDRLREEEARRRARRDQAALDETGRNQYLRRSD